jgi:hypothetical protein
MSKKVLSLIVFFIMAMSTFLSACGVGEPSTAESPSTANTSSDLFVVVGQSSANFAGNGKGDGLLLDQFSKQSEVDLYVEIVDDRKLDEYRSMMLDNLPGAPDVLICDDTLGCDGLQGVKQIASHKVGAAIREDIANQIGLSTNTISYASFAELSKPGQPLKPVSSNGLAGYAALENFFSTMAWCSQTDASNLTADIVKRSDVQVCGKTIYDNIKSTNGGQEALNLVFNSADDQNGFNTVITFDSNLLGDNGLNAKLLEEGKPIFKFFYFKEATAQANIGIGTRKFNEGDIRIESASSLLRFFYEGENGDASQKFINLSGFTEGSAGLFSHYDDAFNVSWGVASNPIGVQIVNSPVPAVAEMGKVVYFDLYKRRKIVFFKYDTSGSTRTDDISSFDKDGNPERIIRLQAISRAVSNFTNPEWQAKYNVTVGPKDELHHGFFATLVSQEVSTSTGPNTQSAGDQIVNYIGPSYGPYCFEDLVYDPEVLCNNEKVTALFADDNVTPYEFGGTAIFDAANSALNDILENYDPNADYYIVVLTDGEWTEGMPGVVYDFLGNLDPDAESFYKNWLNAGKQNITFIGIQFGDDGNSLDAETVTNLMNGDTYDGANDEDLSEAFKFILGN